MSEQVPKKQGFLERKSNRREFMKVGCQGIAGAAVSMSILKYFTSSAQAAGVPLADGLIIADPNRCSGCKRCETVCTTYNDGKAHPYISRVKVSRNYNFGLDGPRYNFQNADGQFGNFKIIAEPCMQCAHPVPCVEVCPVDAISADDITRARVVDQETCIGCTLCTQNCPWAVITVDPESRKAQKCFLCYGKPECVANCPNGALQYVPWREVQAVVRRNRAYS